MSSNSTSLPQSTISSLTEEQKPILSPSNIEETSKDNNKNNNTLNTSTNIAVGTQQPLTPQQPPPPKTPSAATKLVNKFATFTPGRMKSKGSSDRQLIVETAYYGNRNANNGNSKKDSQQTDSLRPVKATEAIPKTKKKKRSPNITEGMSRAEIFAANVASAVDAAEDEDFIYGDRGRTRTPSLTSLNGSVVSSGGAVSGNGINQQLPPPTFTHPHMPPDHHDNYGYTPNHHAAHYQFPNLYVAASMPNSRRVNPYHTYSSHPHHQRSPFYEGGAFYNGNTPGSETDDGTSNYNNKKGSSSNNLLSAPHKPTGVMRASLPDMSRYSKGHPNYGTTGYYHNDPFYHNWYGVGDDERLPLFAKWRRPPYEDQRRTCCASTTFSLTTFLIFSIVAFCYLIYFASSQPLTEVAITDIANVLAADKEIMFDMHVKARNLDIWDVKIMNANLKVFAAPYRVDSSHLSTITSTSNNDINSSIENFTSSKRSNSRTKRKNKVILSKTFTSSQSLTDAAPNEYLGQIFDFDEPLVFQASSNRTGVVQVATAQVTLKNPGEGDQDAQDKWSHLLRQGFQLTVRGILKYSLPFSKDQVARVCFVRRVEGSGTQNGDDVDKAKGGNDDNGDDSYQMGVCGEEWED
ncbi:6763_t:CDS:2 [Ambispora gerdemannii]|uniref:6763_t:CDS:1 n=1 Tax=Ambispora gerdemannii TaxID=144530 RepID=A0A9N8YS00_9GLOM|nr:6763_t:CDS:2 [Ambispora gerdemannii]